MKYCLIILAFLLFSCSSNNSQAKEAVMKYLEDQSFKNNRNIEIKELNITSVVDTPRKAIAYRLRLSILESILQAYKVKQEAFADSITSYQKKIDSLKKVMNSDNNRAYVVTYLLKATEKGNNIKDSAKMYFENDWAPIRN